MSDYHALRPDEVRGDYNRTLQDLQGEYVRYRWLATPTQRRHFRQTRIALAQVAKLVRPGPLLEVGCGPAVWTSLFLDRAQPATLVDISDEMLEGAKRALSGREGVNFLRADFAEADLALDHYESALSVRAFEYMPDKEAMLRRFVSLLRPGGRLVLVTKNAGWGDHRRSQKAVAERSQEEVPRHLRLQAGVMHWTDLLDLAGRSGLTDIEIRPVIIGTYDGLLAGPAGRVAFDIVHRLTYGHAMKAGLDEWTESVLLTGTRS
jgi:ubiquinone/menaquinone biosynthesis C-methylase UbiE